jgi:hypothetical protein
MTETPLSRAPVTPERVLYDARAVADVCAASAFSSDPAQVRAVLRTSPAAHSGSASVEGVFLDAATGTLVDSMRAPASLEGRQAILRYEGTYEVLAVLSGRPDVLSGQYSWTENMAEYRGPINPRDIYDPFGRPGVVACRYDPGARAAPFDQVRLLPEDWHVHAVEAEQAPSEPHAATARRWLSGPNDLLYARAARSLARSGQFTPALLATLRGQAEGYRRAVLHFVTLASSMRPAGTDALTADLAPGSDPGHRRAAAVGLLSARLFAPEATAAAISGWPPAMTPGGLLDPALIAGDDYVREAFEVLSPGSTAR